MARRIGAGLQGLGQYIPTFGGLPPEGGELRVDWTNRPQLVAAERPPWEIYVDRHGRRWIAEDEPSIDRKERVLAGVDRMTFWMVFDARALRESRPMVHGWSPAELHARCGQRRGLHRAADLAVLARLAGIDPDGLTGEVARYNAAVAAGIDAAFGRRHLPAPIAEPPFYAVENHPVTLITFAGVDVDAHLQVRRGDGGVIPGLYAVGRSSAPPQSTATRSARACASRPRSPSAAWSGAAWPPQCANANPAARSLSDVTGTTGVLISPRKASSGSPSAAQISPNTFAFVGGTSPSG